MTNSTPEQKALKPSVPSLSSLKTSISDMSDEELDATFTNVRASRRNLVSDAGKVKRRGSTKVKRKKKLDIVNLMSAEERAEMKKYLDSNPSGKEK